MVQENGFTLPHTLVGSSRAKGGHRLWKNGQRRVSEAWEGKSLLIPKFRWSTLLGLLRNSMHVGSYMHPSPSPFRFEEPQWVSKYHWFSTGGGGPLLTFRTVQSLRTSGLRKPSHFQPNDVQTAVRHVAFSEGHCKLCSETSVSGLSGSSKLKVVRRDLREWDW